MATAPGPISAGAARVLNIAPRAVLTLARRAGADEGRLLAGLAVDPAHLDDPRGRISWDDYAEILDRLERALGAAALERHAETLPSAVPEIVRLASNLVSPRALFHLVIERVDPVVYPMMAFRVAELGGDLVRVTAELEPGYRPCAPFFRASTGATRGVPNYIGLPKADVVEQRVSDRSSDLVVRLPASRTIGSRLRRAAPRLFWRQAVHELERNRRELVASLRQVQGIHDELRRTHGELTREVERREQLERSLVAAIRSLEEASGARDEIGRRLERARDAWNLTGRQTDVLRGLARGETNAAIGERLGCTAKTVEQHVTALLQRAGVDTRLAAVAKLWCEPWTGEVTGGRSGRKTGPPRR